MDKNQAEDKSAVLKKTALVLLLFMATLWMIPVESLAVYKDLRFRHAQIWIVQEKVDAQFQDVESRKAEHLKDLFHKSKLLCHFRMAFDYNTSVSPSETMAGGGWISYNTPWWHRMSIGVTGYTSLPFIPDGQDPSPFLTQDHNKGYASLGEAYFQTFLGTSKTKAKVFRQDLGSEDPMLNNWDTQMTPITYEAYLVESRDIKHVTLRAALVTRIKGRTDTEFITMSKRAFETYNPGNSTQYDFSALRDKDFPVVEAAIIYMPADTLKLQVRNYYCHDFMNSVYLEENAKWKLTPDWAISLWMQGYIQHDVGEALGGKISTGMYANQLSLHWKTVTLYLGSQIIGDNGDLVLPWGVYNGYVSLQEYNFIQAGSRAGMGGLSWDITPEFSAAVYNTYSDAPPHGRQTRKRSRNETYVHLDYHFSGKLKGLSFLLKYSHAYAESQPEIGHYDHLAVFANYALPVLPDWPFK